MNKMLIRMRSWWKSEWDLFIGEKAVGSLTMKKKLSYALAEIDIRGKKWEAGYTDWAGANIFLKNSAGEEVGKLTSSNWWGTESKLVLEGHTYMLSSNAWQTRFVVKEESGREVVILKPRWFKGGAEVETKLSTLEETALLITMMVFYKMKLYEASAAAASGGS